MNFFSQSGNITCNYTLTCLAITPSFRILSAFSNPLAKESIAPACKRKIKYVQLFSLTWNRNRGVASQEFATLETIGKLLILKFG